MKQNNNPKESVFSLQSLPSIHGSKQSTCKMFQTAFTFMPAFARWANVFCINGCIKSCSCQRSHGLNKQQRNDKRSR